MTINPISADLDLKLFEYWKPHSGIIAWLSEVNHKEIGKRYIVSGFMFFALAGIAALLMRIQLMYPENTFLDADQYNRLFSVHGYPLLVISLVAIGIISFGLWVHHMFTTGLPILGSSVFTISGMVISIPSGV